MRTMTWFAAAVCIACITVAAPSQRPRPGNLLATDESGAVWEVDRLGNAFAYATLIAPTWGVTFDADGRAIVAGRGVVWRIDDQRRVTTVVAGLHLSPIPDIEVNAAGNYWLTAFGNNLVIELNPAGQPLGGVPLPGATRAWGMGIDPVSAQVFVAADAGIYRLDPGQNTATLIWAAAPGAFLQGGAINAAGRFVFADETARALIEIDGTGTVTTLVSGPGFVDLGEGVAVDELGRTWLSDDGAIVGPPQNRIYVVGAGGLGLTTVTLTSQITDVNSVAMVPGLLVAASVPTVRIGQTATLAVTSSGAALRPFVFASALGASVGIPLPGGRTFPLDGDGLFFASATNALPATFAGFQGKLSLGGSAGLRIRVPASPAFVGVVLHTAGVTLDPRARGGIHLISNATAIRIDS